MTALAIAAGCGSNPTTPSQAKILPQPAGDERSKASDSDTITISSAELHKGLDRTKFAIGERTSKYSLDGILLEVADKRVRLIATDGRRMAVYEVGESLADNQISAFLPKDSFSVLSGFLDKEQNVLRISIRQNELEVKGSEGRVVLPTSAPRFPDWKKVMPDTTGYGAATVSADPILLALVKSYQSQEEEAYTHWSFSPSQLKLTPSPAKSGQTGEIAISFAGSSVSTSLDPRFTIPFFRLLDSSEIVTMQVLDSESPVVFSAGPRLRYVVMPMAPEQK